MAAVAVLGALGVAAAAAAMSAVVVVVGPLVETRGRPAPAAYLFFRPGATVEGLPGVLAAAATEDVPAAMLLAAAAAAAVDEKAPPLPEEAEVEAEAHIVKALVVREIPVLRDRPPLLML